jgi:hypothetical protein
MKKAAIFILVFIFATAWPVIRGAEGKPKVPENMSLDEVIKELKGTWTGRGAGEEVRFRHRLLTLIVKHEIQFFFYVDEKGNVSGEGSIEFSMVQDTTGLDDLAAQVRGMLGLLPSAVPGVSGSKIAQEATKEELKGLTKIQYKAPHLKHGKELRHFKFTGRITGGTTTSKELSQDRKDWLWPDDKIPTNQKVIALDQVLNFTEPDGAPNSTLIAEWEVNGKREEKAFPCWSPFLKKPGILRRGPGSVWLVEFQEKGTHREGKNVWQEYGYIWMARLTEKEK